ncbi:MAG: hypothetical protein AABW68_05400 [archaeon]
MIGFRWLIVGLIVLASVSFVSAWGAYVPETYQSSQVALGSFYQPSSPYQGWDYYAYAPNSGYPVMGGGRFYPSGYLSGSYGAYPSYSNYHGYSPYGYSYGQSLYGVPVHTTVDFYYRSGSYSFGCTIYSC